MLARSLTCRSLVLRQPVRCQRSLRVVHPARRASLPAPLQQCQGVADSADGLNSYMLKPMTTQVEQDAARTWVATAITTWLNEEWTVLPEHDDIGAAAAAAYVSLRVRGEDDMGNIVLSLASELMSPQLGAAFRASFTDPFEVANKVTEMVMMQDGCDVCCTSAADRDRLERVNGLLSSASAGDA